VVNFSEHAAVQRAEPVAGSATFGRITSTITDKQQMKFGVKYFL
jgi:hypothetical protein